MGMKREEDPQLSGICLAARKPGTIPIFRAERGPGRGVEIPDRHSQTAWFNLRRLVPAFSAAAAVAIAVFTFQALHHQVRLTPV